MKSLYITAVVTFSGKTALALGIGLKLQADGRKVGYLKPVSTQPYLFEGKVVDEDADFVRRTLGLDTPASELAPVVIDDVLFDKMLQGKANRQFMEDVQAAYAKAAQGKDVLLVEGGASLREGYAVDLSPVKLINALNLPTLGVVRYRSGVMLVDDVLALRDRVRSAENDHLVGVVINSVPTEVIDQVRSKVVPFLERQGVPILGVLPHNQALMSISVGELIQTLEARVLTAPTSGDVLIENLSVGAMSVESAIPHFRRTLRKAVITGGDRADIQAAALETSTAALVLTGNLQPSSTILQHAEERGVAVLLVPHNTIETVERLERVFGKTRLAHPEKLNRFREILDANLDWTRLYAALGV
jgi:BioD-like phosphotransacetylase family protein